MQITTKTNQASIKAGEIIKLIRQWKRNGVTDAIIPKQHWKEVLYERPSIVAKNKSHCDAAFPSVARQSGKGT